MTFSRKSGSIALGANDSYHVINKDGTTRYRNVPRRLHHLIKSRRDTLKFVSLGPNGEWYASFQNCDFWGNTTYDFDEWMQRNSSGVCAVSFGPNSNWHVSTASTESPHWFLPHDIRKRLCGHKGSGRWAEQIAMNDHGDWWIAFSDGSTRLQVVSGDQNLEKFGREAVHVAFGPHRECAVVMKNGEVLTWGLHDTIWRLPEGIDFADPEEIRFTQDSILPTFGDGTPIQWLANNLKRGVCSVDEIPPIRVMFSNRGIFWALDNRRLWAYRKANLSQVPVIPMCYCCIGEEFERKKTTRTNGFSVKVIGEEIESEVAYCFLATAVQPEIEKEVYSPSPKSTIVNSDDQLSSWY